MKKKKARSLGTGKFRRHKKVTKTPSESKLKLGPSSKKPKKLKKSSKKLTNDSTASPTVELLSVCHKTQRKHLSYEKVDPSLIEAYNQLEHFEEDDDTTNTNTNTNESDNDNDNPNPKPNPNDNPNDSDTDGSNSNYNDNPNYNNSHKDDENDKDSGESSVVSGENGVGVEEANVPSDDELRAVGGVRKDEQQPQPQPQPQPQQELQPETQRGGEAEFVGSSDEENEFQVIQHHHFIDNYFHDDKQENREETTESEEETSDEEEPTSDDESIRTTSEDSDSKMRFSYLNKPKIQLDTSAVSPADLDKESGSSSELADLIRAVTPRKQRNISNSNPLPEANNNPKAQFSYFKGADGSCELESSMPRSPKSPRQAQETATLQQRSVRKKKAQQQPEIDPQKSDMSPKQLRPVRRKQPLQRVRSLRERKATGGTKKQVHSLKSSYNKISTTAEEQRKINFLEDTSPNNSKKSPKKQRNKDAENNSSKVIKKVPSLSALPLSPRQGIGFASNAGSYPDGPHSTRTHSSSAESFNPPPVNFSRAHSMNEIQALERGAEGDKLKHSPAHHKKDPLREGQSQILQWKPRNRQKLKHVPDSSPSPAPATQDLANLIHEAKMEKKQKQRLSHDTMDLKKLSSKLTDMVGTVSSPNLTYSADDMFHGVTSYANKGTKSMFKGSGIRGPASKPLPRYKDPSFKPLLKADLLKTLFQNNYEVFTQLGNHLKVTDKNWFSETVVSMVEGHSQALLVPLLKHCIDLEIERTTNPGALFRDNDYTVKLLSATLQSEGRAYLEGLLGQLLSQIIASAPTVEIDPRRIEPGQSSEENLKNLTGYCAMFIERILSSHHQLPLLIKQLCRYLQASVVKKFPEDKQIAESLSPIGGLLFLRFFCPAIFSPQKVIQIEEIVSSESSRALVLISKTIQMLANGLKFGTSSEQHMCGMNPFIDAYLSRVKEFFVAASTIEDGASDEVETVDEALNKLEKEENMPEEKWKNLLRFLHLIHSSKYDWPDAQEPADFTKFLKRWECPPLSDFQTVKEKEKDGKKDKAKKVKSRTLKRRKAAKKTKSKTHEEEKTTGKSSKELQAKLSKLLQQRALLDDQIDEVELLLKEALEKEKVERERNVLAGLDTHAFTTKFEAIPIERTEILGNKITAEEKIYNTIKANLKLQNLKQSGVMYRHCFIASECVSYLTQNNHCDSRSHAVSICESLRQKRLIRLVGLQGTSYQFRDREDVLVKFNNPSKKGTPEKERKKVAKSTKDKASNKLVPGKNIFGISLNDTAAETGEAVPPFIKKLVAHIMQSDAVMTEKGFMSVKANKKEVDEVMDKINRGKEVELSEVVSPHILSDIFKLWLSSLPDPIINFDNYSNFIQLKDVINDDEKFIVQTKKKIAELPAAHQEALLFVLPLFEELCKKQEGMNSSLLSAVLGPILIYPVEIKDLSEIVACNNIVQKLIVHANTLVSSFSSS
eukprot:CAMPEP_0174251522 /NCGR_PEP_ID=MMETSP0439-20130205/1317_1 /TAXON_ID=0 /ORGANISM="Stereomyxa ramosa, Strain Chinc5" /LENGTH=1458 /DNA_ID=CAMNT_0015331857 /DNA_START=33 /DNA_END=4409 /DNA_ORIENTATION=-